MEVLRGSDRIVIPAGDQVFKLPRFSARDALSTTFDASRYGLKGVRRYWGMDADTHQSPRWFLLHGVRANQREAVLAHDFPKIVINTLMLGGGALNIQPRAEQLNITSEDMARIFAEHLSGRVAFIGHMIDNPSNFGICDDGHVRIVDGGSIKLEDMLRNRGEYQRIGAALQDIASLVK